MDQRIDISARGWDYGIPATTRIGRLTLPANDPERLAEFYKRVFDMRAVSPGSGVTSKNILSDGHIEMTIVANPAPGAVGSRTGVNRFGFQVEDIAVSLATASAGGAKPGRDGDGS